MELGFVGSVICKVVGGAMPIARSTATVPQWMLASYVGKVRPLLED